MRTPVVVATLAAMGSIASAAPVATLSEDLDGDGTVETVEVSDLGALTIVQGGPRAKLDLGIGIKTTLAVARYDGRALLIVDQTRSKTDREALIIEYRRNGAAGVAAIVGSTKLGGVGLDDDYQLELDATAKGLYLYQVRTGMRRCDGKPLYLFPQGFDPKSKKFRSAVPPFAFEANVTTLPAKVDSTPASPPVLYQARTASTQVGAGDAGALTIPSELDDGRVDTVWSEGLGGDGHGNLFTFEPRLDGVQARQLRIVPGRHASSKITKDSNRARELAILTAKQSWRVELPDSAKEPLGTAYAIDLPAAVDGCVSVVLVSTYGPDSGVSAIAELEVFADGERAGGGDAMLAKVVADGKDGAIKAGAALARRGAAGATAIDAEIARTSDLAARRRLIAVLVKIQDPAAGAALARAATEGWITGAGLVDLIDALARNGLAQELHDLADNDRIELEARIAAARRLGTGDKELPLLVELAGAGPPALRRAVIDRLSAAPTDVLIDAATKNPGAPASGDLWRALTRHVRIDAAARTSALAAFLTALPVATDYERRYRIVDGIATLGDAAALRTLDALLRGLPASAHSSALRQVAIQAIGNAPRPEALKLVLAFAQDPDPGVRIAVLTALAGAETDVSNPWHTADGPDGIDRVIITALAGDRWPEIRRRAASSLGLRCQRIGPARALGDAVANDREVDVRLDALSALVQCRAAGIDQLLAKTWDNSDAPIKVRSHAVGQAAVLGDPKLGAVLVDKFQRWRGAAIESHEALALAQSAARTIAVLNAPGAAQALLAALDDAAFPEIVSAAAFGLGALGKNCPAAAKAKLNMIARSEDSGQAAVAAKRAAAQCGR